MDEAELLQRLAARDEAAFALLVRRHQAVMVGVAQSIVGSRAIAEEVVQEAWLAALHGLGRFEGRGSLRGWLLSITVNRARTLARRERRTVPLDETVGVEPAVDRSRFATDGHWARAPALLDELDPDRIVGGRELWRHVAQAIEALPAGPRAVVLLRDIEGLSADETCGVLQISEVNQRVLLHRARSRLRAELERLIAPVHERPDAHRAPPALRRGTAVLMRMPARLPRQPTILARLCNVLPRPESQAQTSGNAACLHVGSCRIWPTPISSASSAGDSVFGSACTF